jgi:hypothetical protein
VKCPTVKKFHPTMRKHILIYVQHMCIEKSSLFDTKSSKVIPICTKNPFFGIIMPKT